jgi:hypothetical protein
MNISIFKNGQIQFDSMNLKVFENQYEDMMMEQNRLNRQVFLYVSIHHHDHLLIYQPIHQHILMLNLHIESH